MAIILRRRLQPLHGPIDMAPFINVVLLLLIFFLLSSSFVLQSGVRVDLPSSLYGSSTVTGPLVITATLAPQRTASGEGATTPSVTLFFRDQIATMEQIETALAHLEKSSSGFGGLRSNRSVVLKTDRTVPMGLVFELMNKVLAHNLSVVLATQSPSLEPIPIPASKPSTAAVPAAAP